MLPTKPVLVLVAVVALAASAAAYHRQTPPILAITTSGDSTLPRVPAPGHRLAVALGPSGRQIFRQYRGNNTFEQITEVGDNRDPTISTNGGTLAWDSDCDLIGCIDHGRQIFLWRRGDVSQVTHDPTGTSVNPAISGGGSRLAFESTGDLAGIANGGVRQIFVRASDTSLTQVSRESVPSRNAALDRAGGNVVYESNAGADWTDTGVSQIWFLSKNGFHAPITAAQGASRSPAISSDAKVVAFESKAALTSDGHDTGVSQIFIYEADRRAMTQITSDPAGCTAASVQKISRDWRIAYVCHGQGFYHHLLANQRFSLPFAGGDTSQAIAELGTHFLVVSTTADLLGTGTTAGHRLYLLNLFKLPPQPIS